MQRGAAQFRSERRRQRNAPSRAGECLLICLCCFGLLVMEARLPVVQKVRSVGALVKAPVHAVVRYAAGGMENTQNYLRAQTGLLSENDELRGRLLRQNVDLQKLELLKVENRQLRSLLAVDALLGSSNLIAETLPSNFLPTSHRVTLNIGSRHGAYVGQPIVDAGGVVGQVTRDYLITSEALLISDASHSIPVMIERTGVQTIALGMGGADRRLSLPYLPAHSDVVAGDTVVSSGSGGRFPAGLRVGAVDQVRRAADQVFLEASVRPSAKLEGVRQVLLLRSKTLGADGPGAAAGAAGS